jgi:hypothetical protein
MDVNDFPRQFQAFDVQWEIIETIKAKFSGTRSLVQLVEIKFYGNLVKAENSFAFGLSHLESKTTSGLFKLIYCLIMMT